MTFTEWRAETLTSLECDLIDELTAVLPMMQNDRHIPGMGIAVAYDGRMIWQAGFGFADIAKKSPITTQTVFRSGSMGKTYTGTAIMQLVEQGVLTLKSRLTDIVGFDVINPLDRKHITIEMLLTHQAGLASNAAGSTLNKPVGLAPYLRALFECNNGNDFLRGAIPLWTAPTMSAFQYSNTGMGLLGLVVETINPEGLSYGQYIYKGIIAPLGMSSTRYPDGDYRDTTQVPEQIQAHYATGYTGFGPSNIPSPDIYFNEFPAGLIMTTPANHLRVLMAYLNHGELDGQRILQPDTIAQMLTPRITMPNQMAAAADSNLTRHIGLAWANGNNDTPLEWFGLGGAHMFGFHNDYRAYPKLGLAVSAFSNRWDLPATQNMVASPHPTTWIAEHAAEWLYESQQATHARYSLGYRRAYTMGVTLAISTKCYLGADGAFDAAYLASIDTDGAVYGPFDADGFRDAITDLETTDYSVSACLAFLDGPSCRVTKQEMERIWAGFNVGPGLPLPAASTLLQSLKALNK